MHEDISFQQLPATEVGAFRDRVRAGYAEQKVALGGWERTDAERAADAEVSALFPEGQLMEGHEVWLLRAPSLDDQAIGHLWVGSLRQMSGTFYVFDVEVVEAHRGRGLGRRAMEFAEERAVANGCSAISLHVFGGNTGAIALYRRLGYEVIDLTMKKTLVD